MSEAPVATHQPCPACGSTDAAVVFASGGTYCYSCKGGTKGDGDAPEAASPFKNHAAGPGVIPVQVMAVTKRGIPEATAQKFGYGYGEFGGQKCQVATYCDARGRPVAQKLRFAGKKFMVVGDSQKMGLFGSHLWREGGKSLVVTEGELDALSVSAAWEDKWPVVSIPSGAASAEATFRKNLEYLEKFEKVVICFDQDEPGLAAAEAAAAVLSPGKAFVMRLPMKDPNEMLMAGRAPEIVKAYWDAKPWRPDAIVGFDDVWKKVLGWDSIPAIPIANKGLQEKIMGWRPGEITMYVAGTGTGKSTAVMEVAADLARRGVKVGYISLEDGPEVTAMGLVSVLVSRRLLLETRPNLNAPEVREAVEILQRNVTMYDSYGELDADNLLAKMRFLAQGEGCKVIILDHISIAVSGGDLKNDERRTIDKLMKGLVSLVRSTQVHVLAISHLSRREGTPHEEGRKITLADLRGSHGISQASFNVIACERDQQAEGEASFVSTLRVLKCRRTGRTGIAGYVRYDPQTGRQSECDAPKASTFQVQDDTGADDIT